MPVKKTPSPTKRTTPKKEKLAGRTSSFDSAAAEWRGDEISFTLDKKEWECHGAPTADLLLLISGDGLTMLQFINCCVMDKEGWASRIEDTSRPITLSLITAIYNFLLGAYFGEDMVGKS